MIRPLRRSLLLVLLLALACGDDEGPRVPMPLATTDDVPTPTDTGFEPRRGETFPQGVASVSVEGLSVPDAATTHALLVSDLDGDGDRDALLLRVDVARQVVGVSVAIREGGAFRVRAPSPLPLEGCVVEAASLTHATRSSFVAEARTRCTAEGVDESRTMRWILSNEAAPRVRLVTSTRGETTLSFAFEDLDDDGHEDVRGTVGAAGRETTLRWLDRPGGLALDRAEPAASVRAAMADAREQGLALARALCLGDDATLRLGPGRWGLDCPEELLGAARIAQTDALLRAGRLVEALAAMDGGAVASAEALDAAARSGVTQTRLPFAYRGEPSLDVTHLALGFLVSEGAPELRVQGASIDRVGRDGQARPADAEPPLLRSGDEPPWTVVRTRGNGCGAEASLALFLGGTLGGAHEVTIAQPDGCEDEDARPWRIVGWAPQGLLAARLGERRVVPITTDGLPAGDPVVLDADAPWPAPARGGRVTPDGDTWILERPEGVLVFSGGRVELWRPEGWAQGPAPSAAAVSADGTEVAVLRGDAIWILSSAR
ncbi:MAG: hypothetical protein H6722_21845 [Sandaracinus sp.]|nr:hypothetical protein [Sandaracinus sp.]MCB9615090.1 hypothetical protein [Sandaracinus sp.]